MNHLAPIALFCFNRPIHLIKTLTMLKKNYLSKNSIIYIFSDAAKNKDDCEKVKMVRDIIKNLSGFKNKKIILRNKNFGLGKNIVNGIEYVFKRENKIIVLEDDLITSKFFLKYMNINLNILEKHENVASIHGYIYPIDKKNLQNNFFIRGADCWGWGTWKRSWKKYEKNPKKLLLKLKKTNQIKEFNFNNSKNYYGMLKKNLYTKNKSWAIQWYASTFLKNMYTLYPKYTYVKNIGLDGSGKNTRIKYNLNSKFSKNFKLPKINFVQENILARKKFEEFFRSNEKNLLEKFLCKIIYG
jgi:hypothetical protein